jgi:hypothetical protein
MPRKPTETENGIPLWLIPQVILKWIKVVGDELHWIQVQRSKYHYYTIRIRTRSVKRESGHRAAMVAA